MFAREYTLKLDKNAQAITNGDITKDQLARDTMKFIEDRFGEVNWKNMWMDKSYRTILQFMFRSFTWFTGSWKALGKAGIDIGKWGWFKVKGEQYELTEKGWWGVNAFITHFMTVAFVSAMYQGMSALTEGEEVETDEETPLVTKLLFPRVNKLDPTKRIAIPSYVTEFWKILTHLGLNPNSSAEPSKLISGRFNSILSNAIDVVWSNEDFRGVTIRNKDDNYITQLKDVILHVMPLPISISTIGKNWRDEGVNFPAVGVGLAGATDAPAAAKRSKATNLAFEIRRKEYKGKEVTPEKMEEKDQLKRAMAAYQKGDKSQIDELLREGKISKRQFDIALTRIPRIGDKANPKYLDQLSQAFKGLTIEGKLEVWKDMSEAERETHLKELKVAYNNMRARKDKPEAEKKRIKEELQELGIL
jgi:hypothetical protein